MVKNCWHKLNVTISLINQTVIVFFHFNKNCCKITKYFKSSISSEHGDSCPERSRANKQGDSLHTILPFHSPSLSPDLMDRYFPPPLPPPLSLSDCLLELETKLLKYESKCKALLGAFNQLALVGGKTSNFVKFRFQLYCL